MQSTGWYGREAEVTEGVSCMLSVRANRANVQCKRVSLTRLDMV
jgi:hypothetical protein